MINQANGKILRWEHLLHIYIIINNVVWFMKIIISYSPNLGAHMIPRGQIRSLKSYRTQLCGSAGSLMPYVNGWKTQVHRQLKYTCMDFFFFKCCCYIISRIVLFGSTHFDWDTSNTCVFLKGSAVKRTIPQFVRRFLLWHL